MTVSFVSGVDGGGSNTLSVTVAAGTNCLVVHVASSDTDGDSVSGITYGGVAMTRLGGGVKPTNTGYLDTWILLKPAVGTANVVVSWNGTVNVAGVVVSASMYSEVDIYGVFDSDTSGGNNLGSAISSGFIESACSGYDADQTKPAAFTSNQSQTSGSTRLFSAYKAVIPNEDCSSIAWTTSGNYRLNSVLLYQLGGQAMIWDED